MLGQDCGEAHLPASAAELEPLWRQAAQATRAGSKSFYFASHFFPPELTRAAHCLYWFCRTTDDLVDEAPHPEQAEKALTFWEQQLRSARTQHPVLQLFSHVRQLYAIPISYPLELIEGVRMDLTRGRYETFADLQVFCYRVASVVGLMMMHVIGFEGQPHQQAIDLGIALQLTNILRDVGEDLQRGRIYLPLEDLRRFHLSEEDLMARIRDRRFAALMQFQIARARDFYRRGIAGIPSLHPRGRFAVEVAARLYAGILDAIERNHYDVFTCRAVVSARRKCWITVRCLAPLLRTPFASRAV